MIGVAWKGLRAEFSRDRSMLGKQVDSSRVCSRSLNVLCVPSGLEPSFFDALIEPNGLEVTSGRKFSYRMVWKWIRSDLEPNLILGFFDFIDAWVNTMARNDLGQIISN
jgi:hypothetical protein